ncbi:hypothetical protein AAGG74_17045 [Bacillus mexicanus]|uniref:hypothetical protein n=1 Tax=Bacillus mexicanus TaxID=2834415 RepID=UPI003D23B272
MFKKEKYFLGCQLGFHSNCYMFIDNVPKKSTERGNIEIFKDGSLHWFFTTNTNTDKQTFIEELKVTPRWFQKLHESVYVILHNNIYISDDHMNRKSESFLHKSKKHNKIKV